MTASKIEWTDRSDWNPIRGCTRVSPGCQNCYAEGIAGRFSRPGQPFYGYATRTSQGARWTGKIELVEDRLTLPLRWKKPARIFASSTSDIFHESLPDEAIDRIFAVMALAPQHTFQVLTKRADRMRAYMNDREAPRRVWDLASESDNIFRALAANEAKWGRHAPWPLRNVWLGVSVEDQQRADERIPDLLATPAVKRFLSCEPLLGPMDLGRAYATKDEHGVYLNDAPILYLDWVIVGGESGPNARPMHPAWAHSLRDQCQAAGVPFFFKQWGDLVAHPAPGAVWKDGTPVPEELEPVIFERIGKARAGRLLDGREWSEFPA